MLASAIPPPAGERRARLVGQRWAPASGVALCVLWAPMALLVPRLPDLASAAAIARFYHENADALKIVILLVAAGYLFLLVFLATVVARMRRAEGHGPLTWIAFASAVMFMTSLNVALGLAGAAAISSNLAGAAAVAELHRAAFVLAAPAAPAGATFFLATSALSLRTRFLPRWLGLLGLLAAAANLGALGGVLVSSGPLNSGDGLVGGIAVPLLAWQVWILLASVWLMREARGSSATTGTDREVEAPSLGR